MKAVFFAALNIVLWATIATSPVSAWQDCPYGKINDPYPGSCGNYVDTNNNKICDHSESKPDKETLGLAAEKKENEKDNLVFFLIFLPISFYFLHWYGVNKLKLGKKTFLFNLLFFRLFWNIVLLISFVIGSLSGLLWAFGTRSKDISWWHNQTGIVFVVVAFLHFLSRINSLINQVKFTKR